jgi:hypothetical protein
MTEQEQVQVLQADESLRRERQARLAEIDAEPDWGAGVRKDDNPTPEGLRKSALMALKHAKDWADTAERLLEKADDLETAAITKIEGQQP